MAGWKVAEIVQHVDQRTERRASKKIDLRREFFLALDEFCGGQHYWWRKRRAVVTLVVGQKTYDLSDVNGADAGDFAQFEAVWLIDTDGVTPVKELALIDGDKGQIKAFLNTTQDTPSGYFIDTNQSVQTLSLQAPSNVAQKLLIEYWAIPQVTTASDTTDEDVPLVPVPLQYGLFYALERRVYEFLYGQEDPRFVMANSRYAEFNLAASQFSESSTRKTASSRATPQATHIVRAHN